MSPIMEEQSSNIPHQLEDAPSLGKFLFFLCEIEKSHGLPLLVHGMVNEYLMPPIQKFKCSSDQLY